MAGQIKVKNVRKVKKEKKIPNSQIKGKRYKAKQGQKGTNRSNEWQKDMKKDKERQKGTKRSNKGQKGTRPNKGKTVSTGQMKCTKVRKG